MGQSCRKEDAARHCAAIVVKFPSVWQVNTWVGSSLDVTCLLALSMELSVLVMHGVSLPFLRFDKSFVL